MKTIILATVCSVLVFSQTTYGESSMRTLEKAAVNSSRSVENIINSHFYDMGRRAQRDQLTVVDNTELNVMYGGMIAVGSVLYPEAAKVLRHIMWGSGEDIELSSRYIRNSPVIRKCLKGKGPGSYTCPGFRQSEDRRLSYVFNPYQLVVRDMGDRIEYTTSINTGDWAPITRSSIRTEFDLGVIKIKIPDSLVRSAVDIDPFTASATWSEDK